MKKACLACLVLCLSGFNVSAADREVETVLREREVAVSKANDEAVKKLDKIMVARTKKGDIDGAMSVKKTIEGIKGGDVQCGEKAAENAGNDIGGLPGNPANRDKMSEVAVKRDIETRYVAFSRSLVVEDLDSACEILDPKIREQVAPQIVRGYLGIMSGAMKIAQVPKGGARVASVKLGVRGNEAKVVPALKVRGLTWEDQKPQYWVSRNGKWFLGDEKELENFK